MGGLDILIAKSAASVTLLAMSDNDDAPISQRPTLPDISTAPPPPEYGVVEMPKIPKSRAALEAAWLMVEKLFGKEVLEHG